MTPDPTDLFTTEAARRDAVRRRDKRADPCFLYSVSTTGVFCRPSCAARPALPRHIAFHGSVAAAVAAGFRPCKRCRPDLPPRAERDAALITRACAVIAEADTPPSLTELAATSGLSAPRFHRLFRAITGVTPKAYADARRQRRVQAGLTAGGTVTATMYDAGFNSSGRFYEAADAMLGMTPTAWRAGAPGEAIRYACAPCALGVVLVAATARGVCAILLGDRADALATELHRRFPRAAITGPEDGLAEELAAIVARIARPGDTHPALPLDIRGTAFQRRVWEALRAIPAGRTETYGAVARRIGHPSAVRAVAAACGANPVAVVVPCHRVIGADGALTGYRWGVERKRELLRREAEVRREAEARREAEG
jgi:AraC family transcriptional regulator of adaptative response/methylated-DNA-[protein]-cysteine methyltransferase